MGGWGDGGMGRWGDWEIKTPRNKNLLHHFSCVGPLLCFTQMKIAV
ncbi:hypothetical protein [Okeania sp. KiyG1]|nr:hypothetical protein [Okeania sp. KiyG1]